MKTIEFTTVYKMGHTQLKCKTTMAARNVNYIQEIPMEVPEYADGMQSRVGLPNGESLNAIDKYETLSALYESTMQDEV